MDYNSLKKEIETLKNNSKIKVKVIGKSVLNKDIYALLITNNKKYPWVIITAAIHAREHLSCDLVIKQIKQYLLDNISYNYNVAFVPMVNPDGADLAINNLQNVPNSIKDKLIYINKSEDFNLFKANANGVDLNNNFAANWHMQFTKTQQPSSQGYYGSKPFSEPETQALAKFTKKLMPFITLSYHLKGEEIYFDFFQNKCAFTRDSKMAKVFAKSTGYKIKSTQTTSSGGYKDWCVQKLKIAALTIEVGSDKFKHPYPTNQIDNIFNKNKDVFNCLQQCLKIHTTEKLYGQHESSIKASKKSL